jgi:hypothetical protein
MCISSGVWFGLVKSFDIKNKVTAMGAISFLIISILFAAVLINKYIGAKQRKGVFIKNMQSHFQDNPEQLSNDYFGDGHDIKPMPWPDRDIFTDSDGNRYFVAWSGKGPSTSFGLNRKKRISIYPTKILKAFSGHMYIAGIESGSSSESIFMYRDVSSQIKSEGFAPGHLLDWAERVLSLDASILDSLTVNDDCETLEVVWDGRAPITSFTYRADTRERVSIVPVRLLRSRISGALSFLGECGNDTKEYNPKKIETLIHTEGYKKLAFNDWVDHVLLTSN